MSNLQTQLELLLENKTLKDILSKLSTKTQTLILKDLSLNEQKRDEETLYIFTDGGCSNNGKKNAKGGFAVFITDDTYTKLHELNCVVQVPEPTNQKCELLGIQKAMEIISDNKESLMVYKKIIIVTDSMYSIKCVTDWYRQWELNGWKTATKQDVKNADIIKRILELKESLPNVFFKHVFSHITAPKDTTSTEYTLWKGNAQVDEMVKTLI